MASHRTSSGVYLFLAYSTSPCSMSPCARFQCVFLNTTIPSIIYNNAPPPDILEHTIIEPEGMHPDDQTTLRLRLEANIYDLVSHALPTIPRGTPPKDFPPALLDYVRREVDTRHADTIFMYSPTHIDPTTLTNPVDTLNGSKATQLYVTIEIPACLFGSVHTPLGDLVQQCLFHKINPDGSMEPLSTPLTIPIMSVAAAVAATPSTPPMAPSTLPTPPSTRQLLPILHTPSLPWGTMQGRRCWLIPALA